MASRAARLAAPSRRTTHRLAALDVPVPVATDGEKVFADLAPVKRAVPPTDDATLAAFFD